MRIESVKPNPHILWCRSCNEVRWGRWGKCSKCGAEMWDVHRSDALTLIGEEACNPGCHAPELMRLARNYVGEAAANEAAAAAVADKKAMLKRREGKTPCKRGKHRIAQDGRCDYCGGLVCTHAGCGNIAGIEGLCHRHRLTGSEVPGGVAQQIASPITTNVAGASYCNDDGSKRQTIVAGCRPADRVLLRREPGNAYDRNAIQVLRFDGQQIGYLPANVASELATQMDRGITLEAQIQNIFRSANDTLGVTIVISSPPAIADTGSSSAPDPADVALSTKQQAAERGHAHGKTGCLHIIAVLLAIAAVVLCCTQ